jgi:hypothetical protein
LEAHERWAFDEEGGVQRLARLICLCSACHAVTHFGLTELRGGQEWALTHLQAVTGLDAARAVEHVDAAFALWEQRSARVWSLDLTMLTAAGISLAVPPGAAERAALAERTAADARRGETPRQVSAAGGNVPGHEATAAWGDRGRDEERPMSEHGDRGRAHEHGCACMDPNGDGTCDATQVKVTAHGGLPPWALTAPIEQIKFYGPNADAQRAALLELRAAAAAEHALAPPASPVPVSASVVPVPPVPAADASPSGPSAVERAPRGGRRWPWQRGQE